MVLDVRNKPVDNFEKKPVFVSLTWVLNLGLSDGFRKVRILGLGFLFLYFFSFFIFLYFGVFFYTFKADLTAKKRGYNHNISLENIIVDIIVLFEIMFWE